MLHSAREPRQSKRLNSHRRSALTSGLTLHVDSGLGAILGASREAQVGKRLQTVRIPTPTYDGKPCVHGHGTTRFKSNKVCVQCQSRRNAVNAGRNPDVRKFRQEAFIARQKALAAGEKYYTPPAPCVRGHRGGKRQTSTGECIECRTYWIKKYKMSRRNYRLKKVYGISHNGYENILASQGGLCAICKSDDPKAMGFFHIDHNHSTGVIRGLLCGPCNQAIGLFRESPKILAAASNYISKHA